MNLKSVVLSQRRWVLWAALPALLISVCAYAYVSRQPKTYQATTWLYVQQSASNGTSIGSVDVSSSQALIPTYSQMMASPVIEQSVDHAMSARYPGYRLALHSLNVSGSVGSGGGGNQTNTQLLEASVTDTVPQRAADASNAVAKSFLADIASIQRARFQGGQRALQRQLTQMESNIQNVSQQIASYRGTPSGLTSLRAQLDAYQSIYQNLLASAQDFYLGRSAAINEVRIFSPAQVPTQPTGPHPVRIALLAGFLALLAAGAGIFLFDYYDDRLKTPEVVEEIVNAPVLGTVPEYSPRRVSPELSTIADAEGMVAEAFRLIRTNIEFTNPDSPSHTIVITSTLPSEGKSTTAANVARVFAEAGRHTILVDGDLRAPTLHRLFGLQRRFGLTNVIAGRDTVNGQGSQPTGLTNLALIASGPLPPRPSDMLDSARMREFVERLRSEADVVLIDSPPILAFADAAILASLANGVVLVVDPRRTKRRDLRRAREAIELAGSRIVGVVINRVNSTSMPYFYHYSQHSYGYAERHAYAAEAFDGTSSRNVSA